MSASGTSLVGRRHNNEDAFRVREDLGLFLVADGMGGHAGGEIASRLVADAVTRYFADPDAFTQPGIDLRDPERLDTERMHRAIHVARREVLAAATGRLREMGSTLAALWLRGNSALVAHVGDSRVYRLRDGRIEQLTHDHSMIAELASVGARGILERMGAELEGVVTRCISSCGNSEPDIELHEAQPGDVFLLCSDGLTDALDDEAIARVLGRYEDAEEAARMLAARAYEEGSQDNITCVVVHAPKAEATLDA
ncbi:MAG: serine/threonine-protein phosphatase [Sandaracinus sp.]|nr:serine/threonine-protein phosphatase [Sandaracinus sp.]MCB9630990.1 serine/threonine-protein phosphatase [Sandaracinus sp.]